MSNKTDQGTYTMTVTITASDGNVIYIKRGSLTPSQEKIAKLLSSQNDK